MKKFFAVFCMVATLAVVGCSKTEEPATTGTDATDGTVVVEEEEVDAVTTPETTTPAETTPPAADGTTTE